MTKMVPLARTKADREADSKALGGPTDMESDGAHLHLDHHHLKALGVHGNIEAGREVRIHARGKIKHSSSSSDDRGGNRKSMSVHLTHMSMEHEPSREAEREELRGEVEKNYAKASK